jgi:hypothetical protein
MKNKLLLVLIIFSSSALSQVNKFTMTQEEINEFKLKMDNDRKDINALSKKESDLKQEIIDKYPLHEELSHIRRNKGVHLDLLMTKDKKIKKKEDTIEEGLLECMLATLKGQEIKVIPRSKSNETAKSPKECYDKNKDAQKVFQKEFIRNDLKEEKDFGISQLKRLTEISLSPEEKDQLQKGEELSLQISAITNEIKEISENYSKMLNVLPHIMRFETKVKVATRCLGENRIENNRFIEIQSKSDHELSSMEDLLYSNSKCRKAKIDKPLEGNTYCERFNFFINNMTCVKDFSDIIEAENSCREDDESFLENQFKNIKCFLDRSCSKSDLEENWIKENLCITHAHKLEKPLAYQKEAISKVRTFLGDKIARGLPSVATMGRKTIAVIGIKKEAFECKYLVRDFSDQTEKWLPEEEVLNGVFEFHYLNRTKINP